MRLLFILLLPLLQLLQIFALAPNVTILDDKDFTYRLCHEGNASVCFPTLQDCPVNSTTVNGTWHECNSQDQATARFTFTGSGITVYGIAPNPSSVPNTTVLPISVQIDGGQTYQGNDLSSVKPHTPNVSLAQVTGLKYDNHVALIQAGISGTPFNVTVGTSQQTQGAVVWVAGQNPCQSPTTLTDGPGNFCGIPFSFNGLDGLTLEGCGFSLWMNMHGQFWAPCESFSEPKTPGCATPTNYRCGSPTRSFSEFLIDYVVVDQTPSISGSQQSPNSSTAGATTPTQSDVPVTKKKTSGGAIAGAIIGTLIGLGLIAAAGFYIRRRISVPPRPTNMETPTDATVMDEDEFPPAYTDSTRPVSTMRQTPTTMPVGAGSVASFASSDPANPSRSPGTGSVSGSSGSPPQRLHEKLREASYRYSALSAEQIPISGSQASLQPAALPAGLARPTNPGTGKRRMAVLDQHSPQDIDL